MYLSNRSLASGFSFENDTYMLSKRYYLNDTMHSEIIHSSYLYFSNFKVVSMHCIYKNCISWHCLLINKDSIESLLICIWIINKSIVLFERKIFRKQDMIAVLSRTMKLPIFYNKRINVKRVSILNHIQINRIVRYFIYLVLLKMTIPFIV